MFAITTTDVLLIMVLAAFITFIVLFKQGVTITTVQKEAPEHAEVKRKLEELQKQQSEIYRKEIEEFESSQAELVDTTLQSVNEALGIATEVQEKMGE